MASEWLKQLAAEAAGKTPAASTEKEENRTRTQTTSKASQWLQDLVAAEAAKKQKGEAIPPAETGSGEQAQDNTWFKGSSAWDDGYQFGDVLKTGWTSARDVVQNILGGVTEMGEKVVDTGAYLGALGIKASQAVDPNHIFAPAWHNEKTVEKLSDFIKGDLYDGTEVIKSISNEDLVKQVLGVGTEEASVFGEKTDSLMQSAGQLAATAALQAAGVPAWLVTGVTSFGGEAENALQQGATLEQAGLSAAITAGAEVLTEKISGGIKFGKMGTLDDAAMKALARSISDKTARTLLKYGIDVAGEGGEEVLSGVLSALGQKLTYAGDKSFDELFPTEEAFDAFIGGMVLGGGSDAVKLGASHAKGVDFTSGLTPQQEALVMQTYNNRVAEAEKSGKVGFRGKNAIYDNILGELKQGTLANNAQQPEKAQNQHPELLEQGQQSPGKDYIRLEDYANSESSVWRNVDYTDDDTKTSIMQETHASMIAEGAVVKVDDSVTDDVDQAYPDLRDMKKKERTPILKNAMTKLKSDLRNFLNGFKNQSFEFEVNGKVLEATLYNTGINEVLEKVTKDKANMLYSTADIFRNARYLYSTADYAGDPNVYRWNYFYTPVQIGENTVGVRIAIRDMINPSESQIYNWGIKKDASLDGVGRGVNNRISHDVSSDASHTSLSGDAEAPRFTSENATKNAAVEASQTAITSNDSIPDRNQDVNTGEEAGLSLAQRMRQNENVNGGNEDVRTDEKGQGAVAADAGAGDRISDGSGQRNDGAGAGEQVGGLGSRTGQAAQRQSSAADRKARIDRLNRIRSLQLEKVSSADLGVKRGTDGKNLQLIPEEHWDSEMEELAERIWQETGKTASFVMGVIEIQGSNGRIRKVNGVMTGDRILVRVDHLRLTMEQIADHESYHGRVDYFKQRLNQEIRQHIIDTFSEVEFRKVLNKYFDAYEGVYDFGKAQTGEEFERLMQKLEEEVFADAYAGINSFGAGQFTEAVNERLEQLGTGRYRGQAQENGVRQTVGPPDEKFSINEDFAHEVDRWINEGMQTGEQFELGTTGDVLQGLGAIESDIYMLGDKIQTIMNTHPEITKEEIKKIPQIVEDPILILKSRGVGRGDRGNTRLVIFGSVKAQNGQPVLTVLDLRPVESNLVIDDMQKVSSAYTKSSNPTGFISQSDVLYADEKRTAKLLRTIGFQMPIELQQSGYIGSISYVGQNVNINGIPFSEIVKENSENEILTDEEYREKYGLKLPSLEDNTEESYSLDPEDVDRVDAELESEQQRWKEMWLQEQLGEEGVKEYQARKDEQEAQKKADEKQVQQVKQKIDANKRSLKREAAESAANARQSRRLALETKPKEAKKELRKAMLDMFSIPAGQRTEAVAVIDSFADRLLRQGSLTEEDRKAFFDRMYAAGMMTVPADDYLKLGRDAIYKGKIFVNESIRQELGDDWNELRRRAFSAGVYLTNNRADPGVDVWNDDLAQVLPGLFDSEETDLRLALERIIQVAEEGRDERVSLPEYTAMLAEEEYISEDQVLDQMERDMDLALRVFAKSAGLEIKLREQAIKEQAALTKENARQRFQQAQERAERKEMAQRQKEQKDLRELQQKTLKALQWLNRNRNKAPEDLRQTWDEVLSDIDIYAVGAANEMNWSNKYGATWKDLAQMYSYAKENDPNFMPSKDLEKIVSRLSDKKIEDMDPAALSDLYRMAVGLRTEFYNRNNVAGDEERRLFSEVYTDAKQEIKAAPGKYNGKWMDKLFNLDQLTPMNVLQRMAGWNPDSTFYSMAQQLERGERDMRAFSVKAQRLLQDFLTEHESWVKKADGQGKDAIWYELEVPELMELGMGDKPIFGDTVKVYMTPAQKVHMYLESKNVDNLRHMTGGRTFADKELYSQGKRREAFAQGRTIRMAPETVKQIVSDLTPEEMELAEVLDKFYNDFAKGEINRVSNILYGYDKAMGRHYAPIFTNQNYVQSEIGIFDQTAEGVGNLKAREYSKNPSYNIGAFDAFERNVDQTARFVGMAIPARNWNSLLNWREKNDSMGDVITHKWGNEGKNYITDLIATLQGGDDAKTETVSSGLSKLQSNYISAVFGANPGIVLKQLGSIPLAGAYLGNGNMPTPAQIKGIDRELIAKYTQDLEWRTMGYSTPETKQLKDNPNWTQTNKAFKFAFGGGAITAMDGWAASTLWPWAENKVRREHPDLELGTQDQIDKGESLFYKKVAEEFEYAMSRSQSASDEIHQSSLRKSGNVLAKAFTMFRSDSAQTYNTLRQKIGEARYYASTGADEKATQAAKKAVGSAVLALVVNAAWAEGVSFLMALWKNGAKYYRDDEDELTAEAVVGEMVSNMLTSVSGTVVFGDELTGLIGNILTGEKWYGIDAPGLGQLSDLCETIYKAGGGMRDIIEGAVDVLKNGGDVGQYFQDNSSDIRGSILELAEAAAMYIPGLPVSNVEAYLLGALKWISPALHTEYEDMLETAKKGGLSGLEGDALTTRVGNILENRRVTNDAETAKILAGLYEAGYKSAIPSDTPGSVTVGGEDHDLSAYQQQVYNNAWAGIVGEDLDNVVSSEEFLNASEEKQEKMLKTLYGYASDQAKAELFEGAEGSGRAEDIAAFREAGLDMADYLGAVADGIDPDKFLETFGNGLDSDDTEKLLNAIEDLEPEEGKVQVTDVQRWRVCVDLYGNPQFQLAALMTYMTDSQFAKAKTAHTFDVDLDAYVKLYEIRTKHDANGNKSYSQAEYKAAIDTLNVSNDDRAVLWQLATGAKSAKNNPYSSAVGQRVLDAMG